MKIRKRIPLLLSLSLAGFPLIAIPIRVLMHRRVMHEPGNDDGRDMFYATLLFLAIGLLGTLMTGICFVFGHRPHREDGLPAKK